MSESTKDNRPGEWLATLAQLGDLARVRLLRLVEQAELGVGELAATAQLPQSTVSRHLKALHEHGWVVKRTEGTASYYRLLSSALDDDLRRLWETTRDRVSPNPDFADDNARLLEVLASRRADSQAFFGRVGGEWHEMRQELFGTSLSAEALLGLADPDWIVADLGCGTGDAAERLAPVVERVIAIDREPAMLEASRRRLEGFDNIDYVQGDLVAIPLEDASVDVVLVMLVLHHIVEPVSVLEEAHRVLRPGGRVLVVDMVAHSRQEYRHDMGHHHLGFDEATARGWGENTGFDRTTWRRLRPDPRGRGPGLFAASYFKPA